MTSAQLQAMILSNVMTEAMGSSITTAQWYAATGAGSGMTLTIHTNTAAPVHIDGPADYADLPPLHMNFEDDEPLFDDIEDPVATLDDIIAELGL